MILDQSHRLAATTVRGAGHPRAAPSVRLVLRSLPWSERKAGSGCAPRRTILAFAAALALLGVLVAWAGEKTLSSDAAPMVFRLGFSSASFAGVNENDAKAGMKAWAEMLFRNRGLLVNAETIVLPNAEAIAQAERHKDVDAVVLNADECRKLGPQLLSGPFIAGLSGGHITEQYVLLVHRDSGIERLEQLRGRSLIYLNNARTCLAPAWLETALVAAGLPSTNALSRVTRLDKLSKAVLPVFFKQVDACVVTRRGFNTMAELNPQVGQRLRILAFSPEVVPTGFCFRYDYDNPLKEIILSEVSRIKDSPGGSQFMTLFECESLEAHPISCLDSAFELLSAHERISAETNGPAAPAQLPPDSPATAPAP